MSYNVGDSVVQQHFLVKGLKKFDWGTVGTLTSNNGGDIAFKFGRQDLRSGDIDIGDVIRVDGVISDYNGAPQVQGTCYKVEPTPEILADLLPTAGVDVNAEFHFMLQELSTVKHLGLHTVTMKLLQDNQMVLRTLPAGKTMHHTTLGGWVEHTAGILRGALALQDVYRGRLNHDLLVTGAILHDIGKLYEFQLSPTGLVQDYTFLGNGLGHAAIGVGMAMSYTQALGYSVTDPMFAALYNIIGTHAGNREWGACADCITTEAVIISNLDYIDSHINAFEDTLKDVAVGDKEYSKAVQHAVYKMV